MDYILENVECDVVHMSLGISTSLNELHDKCIQLINRGTLIVSAYDNSGGVSFYFYYDGWYYFVDMEIFAKEYINSICSQTGIRSDFVKSRFLTGAMIKARSIQSFAKYYRRYSYNMYPELLFIIQKNHHYSVPFGCDETLERRHIYIPHEEGVEVVDIGDKRNIITYEYVDYNYI